MAKKVKCIECDNSMDWSIPRDEILREERQKGNSHLIDTLKNTVLCGQTMKTKSVEHCQYCKHYEHETDRFDRTERRKRYEKELQERLDKLED